MEFSGKIKGIYNDILSDKLQITFEVNESLKAKNEYEKIKDCEKVAVKVTKYREKRSLNANAYFHKLVGEIASTQNISFARCKNELIHDYGQVMYVGDDIAVIKTNIQPEVMLEMEQPHCYPCDSEIQNGKEIIFYRIYRNTREYNTAEMATLIDGTVQECKDLGIGTATPDEIERIKATWQNANQTL